MHLAVAMTKLSHCVDSADYGCELEKRAFTSALYLSIVLLNKDKRLRLLRDPQFVHIKSKSFKQRATFCRRFGTEVVEPQIQNGSTNICSQIDLEGWHERLL